MARKTRLMQQVEERFKQPLERLLPEMINEYGLSATASSNASAGVQGIAPDNAGNGGKVRKANAKAAIVAVIHRHFMPVSLASWKWARLSC